LDTSLTYHFFGCENQEMMILGVKSLPKKRNYFRKRDLELFRRTPVNSHANIFLSSKYGSVEDRSKMIFGKYLYISRTLMNLPLLHKTNDARFYNDLTLYQQFIFDFTTYYKLPDLNPDNSSSDSDA
jgi:hypothetical protein